MPHRRNYVLCATFFSLLAASPAAQGECDEHLLENTTGAGRVVCPCFVPGERAGVLFELPAEAYPAEILRVEFGWGSQFAGEPKSVERAVQIYAGTPPTLAEPIFSAATPALCDGAINELTIEAGQIPIVDGPFVVALEFENMSTLLGPSMVHDGAGCTPGQNFVFTTGAWVDACVLGVTGNWVVTATYRSVECEPETVEVPFRRTRINDDAQGDLSDAVFLLNFLFGGGESPTCAKAADTNDDAALDLTDAIFFLNFLFAGGESPSPPFTECGLDATADDLSCETFTGC